jgi:GNAT superfamily N-acetyltransferase
VVSRDVFVVAADGGNHRLQLRTCVPADVDVFLGIWAPMLERGPKQWLDRGWSWEKLDAADQLAFDASPEWLVLADEVEEGAPRDLLGVLVTTGPITPAVASLDVGTVGEGGIVWVEYVAIAPAIRGDCPALDRRGVRLKGVGAQLMLAAIQRSKELGCRGRVGLHAEGEVARRAYNDWEMDELRDAPHPTGGFFPVFFGSADWALGFTGRGKVRS